MLILAQKGCGWERRNDIHIGAREYGKAITKIGYTQLEKYTQGRPAALTGAFWTLDIRVQA